MSAPKAIAAGKLFGGLVDCYVLEDKRRVISRSGVSRALISAQNPGETVVAKSTSLTRLLGRLPNKYEALASLPKQRRASARKSAAAITREQRSDAARRGRAAMTPEQKREAARKQSIALTPERRSEAMRGHLASLTPEEKRQKTEAAREAMAAMTAEEKRAVAQKHWATRRANAAKEAAE